MVHNRTSGFTLPEVLIALIVVGMGVASSYGLYIGLAQTLSRTQARNYELELLMSAGEYAQCARLFPLAKDKEEAVTFSYQGDTFILEPQELAPEAMQVRAELGTYRLSRVIGPGQEPTGEFLIYLIPYIPVPEKKSPAITSPATAAKPGAPAPGITPGPSIIGKMSPAGAV